MKVGIAAATAFELQPTINFLEKQDFFYGKHEYEVTITGIGVMTAAYHITAFLKRHQPEYMIQAGIAGTFSDKFSPGAVVMIKEEVLGDLGAEENGQFRDIFDLGLAQESQAPFTGKRLVNPHLDFWKQYNVPAAIGITVNEITTSSSRADNLLHKYNCEIESMEGAAFRYICLLEKIPFIQFRSVANYVTERDKNKWMLKDAVQNLNDKLITIIQQLSAQ